MPDYEDLVALKTRLQSEYAERDSAIQDARDCRYQAYSPEVPAALEAEMVQTPVAHQVVERMVGTLTCDPLTITVPPADESQDAQEQASKMERFISAAVDALEKQADQDVVDKFVEHLIADGHGCLKMLYAPQLWRGFPKREKKKESEGEYNKRSELWKRNARLPIIWQALDPLTVYPMWSEAGLEAVLEVDTRDPLALHPELWSEAKGLNVWDLSRSKKEGGGDGRFEFMQLWTRDTLTYCLDGEIVHRQKHRYGTPPYAYAFGLGSASNEPSKMGQSCLWPIIPLVKYLDRVMSQKATAIRLWAWPTPVVKQSTNMAIQAGTAGQMRTIEVAPGLPVQLWSDEELTFLAWQGVGPDIDGQIKMVQAMIERAGIADPMYGATTGDSGYAINQLIAAARMRFKPIVAHAERALEQQMGCFLEIVESQIKQPLHVFHKDRNGTRGWISLGPDDIKGYRQVRVKLNPLMPTDTYARSSQAINEVGAGLRSTDSAMEMIGIGQPDEERRKILVDRFMRRPEVEEWLTVEAVKRAGLKQAKGGLNMGQVQQAYQMAPPALQGVMAEQFQASAPPGMDVSAIGMLPPGGMLPQGQQVAPADQVAALGQTPPEGLGGPSGGMDMQQIMQIVPALAQRLGMTPEQFVQWLLAQAQQRGVSPMQIIQELIMQFQANQQAPQMGQQYTGGGNQVMAAPTVAAAPPPPVPGRVGPQTRPAGMAQGMPTGPRMTSQER